jgi:hypothetical protein
MEKNILPLQGIEPRPFKLQPVAIRIGLSRVIIIIIGRPTNQNLDFRIFYKITLFMHCSQLTTALYKREFLFLRNMGNSYSEHLFCVIISMKNSLLNS